MNFLEIENMVFQILRDPAKTKYDPLFVQRYINEAEKVFCTIVDDIRVEVASTITTNVGQNEYDLPTDYGSDVVVFYDGVEIPETDIDITIDPWFDTQAPDAYYIKNDEKIGLVGNVPAGKYLKLIYNSTGGKMVNSGDVPAIPKKFHLALVYLAGYMGALEGDDTRSSELYTKFTQLAGLAGSKITEDRFGNMWPVMGGREPSDDLTDRDLDHDRGF
jgi:hypothetical protein